jgi:hypothetical protein
MAPMRLDQDALKRLNVGVLGEQVHLPQGPVQDVVDLAAGCFPRRSEHEAEDLKSRPPVSIRAASPFRVTCRIAFPVALAPFS